MTYQRQNINFNKFSDLYYFCVLYIYNNLICPLFVNVRKYITPRYRYIYIYLGIKTYLPSQFFSFERTYTGHL